MWDIGYYIRFLSLVWRTKGKSHDLFDESIINGYCSRSDLDLMWHMNNSRYLRECDFGRALLLIETGLWGALKERQKKGHKDAGIVVSALQVQYRQSIQLGETFQIRTRLVGWDEKAFYLEQSIILDKNKQIAFLMLIRFVITSRSLTPQMLVDDLQLGSIQSPVLPQNIQIFKENYQVTYGNIKSKI